MQTIADDVIKWADRSEWLLVPQQARTRRSLERIIDAAVRLFCERGFDETTIGDIARDAKVSVGAIYARFADKNAILYTMVEAYYRTRVAQFDAIVAIAAGGERSIAEALDAYLNIMFTGFDQDREILPLIERQRLRDPIVAGHAERLHAHVAAGLATMLAPGASRLSEDSAHVARYIHAIVYDTMIMELLHGMTGDALQDVAGADFRRRTRRLLSNYLGTGAD